MAEKSNPTEEDISLRSILVKIQQWLRYLTGKWKWILFFGLLGLVAGISYAFFTRTEYTATVSFVTDTKTTGSTGFNMYAGLAAQFGINAGDLGVNSDLFSGDNIFDLMQTRLMLQRTLLTPMDMDGKKTLLINRYIKLEKLREKKPGFRNIIFNGDTSALSPAQNSAIKFICRELVAKMDYGNTSKTSSIMTMKFTSRDELFSQAFLETLMRNVEAFYVGTKTKKARENLDVLQRQLDSVKSQLYGAMGSVASFQDINQNLVRQAPRVQQQKSSMKVTINSAIYQQLVTGLETAKMTLQQETPLFEIIDEPVLPLDKKQPGKLKWGLAGAILGMILTAGWLLLRRIFYEIMTDEVSTDRR